MSEWQPIETAPQDGTRILLAFEKSRQPGYGVAVGKWRRIFDRTQPTLHRGPYFVLEGSNAVTARATHWMPLPAPPSLPPQEQQT